MLSRTGLLLALALTASLSACTDTDDLRLSRQYVALGDSYTAAPLIGNLDGRDGCARSQNNYPHLVAESEGLDLRDVSCSAARTDDLLQSQRTPRQTVDPQIDAVTRSTDLVTIGIGFNDFGLSVTAFITCHRMAGSDPDGSPCTDADAATKAQSAGARLDALTSRITRVIEAVQDKAPDAQVLLIGYPDIFPTDAPCASMPVAMGDLPLLRRINRGLNEALTAAAQEQGATYVDVSGPSRGHHLCSDDPWIAGADAGPNPRALIWHPYSEEQELVAELIRQAID